METTVTLVLLPGLDGTEILFGPLIQALPPWVRPVVVPYPASGPTGYEDLQPRVEAAVAGLGEFFVLSWSFGGPLALRLAVSRPDAVRGVILCASFVRAPRPKLMHWRFMAVAPVIGTIRALWRTRLLFRRFASPDLRRAKAETWRRVNAAALAARVRAILAVDARADLAACRAPLLYIANSGDRVVPAHNADEIVAGARHAERATIAGHHFAMFTNSDAAAGAVVRFLQTWSQVSCADRAGSETR